MKWPLSVLLFAGCSFASTQGLSYTTIVRGMVDSDLQERYYSDDPGLKSLAVDGTTGNTLSEAQIAPGINRVFGRYSSLDANNPAWTLMSDAQTYWTDVVVFDDPELNGTVGHFTASLRVFGSASFDLTGIYASGDPYSDAWVYGFWDSWIGTSTDGGGSYLVGGWFGDWVSDEFGNVWYSGDELNQPLTEVTLEFIYGQPFLLRMNMEAYVDASNYNQSAGTVEATLDFSHTAYWTGIGSITDSAGAPRNPAYWSQSGYDWRSPVPEPATLVGLAIGAVLLARRRRSG